MPTADRLLRRVRVIHTLVWAIFAASIVLIPVLAQRRQFTGAAWLSAFVFGEVLVLAVNRMRCPLTAVAARYTDDRRDNFDIYLPLWLARYNKLIFGTLYVVGLGYTLARWKNWL